TSTAGSRRSPSASATFNTTWIPSALSSGTSAMNTYGPSPLRSWPELWSVANSSSNPSAWKNLAALPQLWVSRNTASMPSVVVMSGLLLGGWRRVGVGEVGAQGSGDQGRQGELGLDGAVLQLL